MPETKAGCLPSPKARILAVDDKPVVLDVFHRILALDGFAVDIVVASELAPLHIGKAAVE